MRFVPILFVALCFASFADARPFRRASCSGGNCNVAQPVVVDAKKINPLDLTMAAKAAPVASPVAQSGCVNGQCGVSSPRLRVFRR